jgi:transcriptional regulator with XRE-family HTH domain
MSQETLSEKSGVSRDAIQKLESGQRPARPATIKSLAATLGVEADELMKEGTVEHTKAEEKVEVEVFWEDEQGFPRAETLRFRGEEIEAYGEGPVFTLYECPGGFRVHVDLADGENAYLHPSVVDRFSGEEEYRTYTAAELVKEYPLFAEAVGVRRVRDID